MRRIVLRVLALLSILALVAVAFTGCGDVTENTSKPVESSDINSEPVGSTPDESDVSDLSEPSTDITDPYGEDSEPDESDVFDWDNSSDDVTDNSKGADSMANESTPAVDYPMIVSVEQEEVEIFREDDDCTRRLVYLRFQNLEQNTYKNIKLMYLDNGKMASREIFDLGVGDKIMFDTVWIPNNEKSTPASLTASGRLIWKGTLNVKPAKRSVTIKKSKTYALKDLTPMSLRGINYYPRYQPWTALRTQGEKLWDSEFAEIEKLNVNAIRAINDKEGQDMKLGNCATPEFIEIMDAFFRTAFKHGLRTMFCLTNPSNGTLAQKMREVRSVMEPFMNDGRVIGWDLSNEPDALGLGDGAHPVVDEFCTKVYPKMSEWDPNHYNNIGFAYLLDRPINAGMTFNGENQCWQYHWYRRFGFDAVKNAYDTYFNNRPFMIGECGDTDRVSEGDPLRPGATAANGLQWQEDTYKDILQACHDCITNGLPLIGIFPWTTFEFPKMIPDNEYEGTLGLIREDGSYKPAAYVLQSEYAKFKKSDPAPWEK